MLVKRLILIAAVFTTAIAVACGGGSSDTPAANLSKTVDQLQISITPVPNPLQANQDTQVEVVLNSGSSNVTDGRVQVTLAHSGMSMSAVSARAEPKGGGRYVATMKPTGMTGDHRLTVDVEWNGKPYQAQFEKLNVR